MHGPLLAECLRPDVLRKRSYSSSGQQQAQAVCIHACMAQPASRQRGADTCCPHCCCSPQEQLAAKDGEVERLQQEAGGVRALQQQLDEQASETQRLQVGPGD